MPLVISRALEESFRIGPDILVQVIELGRGRVRLRITAPDDMTILRTELIRRDEDWPNLAPAVRGKRPG